ncbi:LAMI_0G01112g1_1 [Lachancea mirantina]|uniref:Pre-mRNA-splicing factor SLT11 n=1 Tax=Lachancea mirantina TaxID=1230905 RepID=A0A1G4K7E1_9SACH|nr:LAMI_0G01112g1_1 [Lachancea mirantina]
MDSPAICETCLGESDRITEAENGAQCKICTLPFTVYHFRDKSTDTVVRTLICLNCSKQRNVCQCCLLDLQWHIPVEVRDRIVSLLKGSEVATEEARNEMMKRFIALKNGDQHKLGGARITSDAAATDSALEQMKATLKRLGADKSDISGQKRGTPSRADSEDVNVMSVLKKLPIEGILEPAPSFFLYNIDPKLPEWAVVDAISSIVQTPHWRETSSNSVVVNHTAQCGGIRFKTQDLANIFFENVPSFQTPLGSKKGILVVQNSRIHVVAWPQFHRGALGSNYAECRKLASSLAKLVQKDLQRPETEAGELKSTGGTNTKSHKVTKKQHIKKDTKKRRNKRFTLEL